MREAQITTEHGDPAVAERVARALAPDNTTAMQTRVEESQVTTVIRRETTGGLHATLDDYVVNLQVAQEIEDTTQHHE